MYANFYNFGNAHGLCDFLKLCYCNFNKHLNNYDFICDYGPLMKCFKYTNNDIFLLKASDELYNITDHDNKTKKQFIKLVESKMSDELILKINELQLKYPYTFNAIHCRTGDQFTKIPNPDVRMKEHNMMDKIKLIQFNHNEKYILFTDSKILKDMIRDDVYLKDIITLLDDDPIHVSYNILEEDIEITAQKALNTVAEFFLMTRARTIYSILSYDNRFSNFSLFPAYLYNIPLYTIDNNNVIKIKDKFDDLFR